MQASEESNVHQIRRTPADSLQERFERLKSLVSRLEEEIRTDRQRAERMATPTESKAYRVAATQKLLDERLWLTVSDVRTELHVSVKTATRLMQAIAHRQTGVLAYEPAGNSNRLRLYHPSKAILERPGQQ
jgi:hypothetical protein